MIDHDIESYDDLEAKWKVLQENKEGIRAEHSALSTKLYRRSPLRELSQYEKLKRSVKGKPSPQEAEKMASLFSKIEKAMGYEQALALREKIRKQIGELKEKEQQIHEEEKIMTDLYAFHSDMPAHEMQITDREQRRDDTGRQSRTRVTIHKNLVREYGVAGGYLVKIPSRDELLLISGEDAFLYKSGEILSAFL